MSAARDRLKAGYYNSLELSVANPGGMARNGHRTNFPRVAKDVGDVVQEMVDYDDVNLAAITANNAATVTAVNDSNAAAVTAVAGSATAANNSKNAAATSETNAGNSATTSTNAATDAKRTVANNFPDLLDATGSWFTEAPAGDPGAVANPSGAAISNVVGYGYEYTKANDQGQLYTKGLLSASNGKVYEVEAEVEWTVKSGAETPSLAVGLQGLDAAFASTGAQVRAALQAVWATGIRTYKYRFGYAAPSGGVAWPQPGTSIWLRPYVLFNRKSDNSAAVTASTARVRRLTVRDVTAVVAAEIAAAAAAASAASVSLADQAAAEAGSGVGLMSATRVDQAIAVQATPIGAIVKAPASPGARFLLCDGASYLKATYPALGALLGDKFAAFSIATPTLKSSFTFRGLYVEAALAISIGTNGNIQTSPDAATWTERAVSTTGFNEGAGAVKLAAKYYAYGLGLTTATRCLVSSANGTTGWADVTAFGTFNNGQGSISSMAYGVINGSATIVAVGGAQSSGAQIKWSTDEGAAWSILGAWTAGPVADAYSPLALIANGVLGVWCPSPTTFKRSTTMAALADVIGVAAAPVSVGVGNGLFVCVLASGEVYTSTDLLTFTPREPLLGMPAFGKYLGYVNGAHHFLATVSGVARVYATADYRAWYRVVMPQAVANITGPLRTLGTKLLAPTSTVGAVAVASFTHNPATEVPLPEISDNLPSYIKAT